MKTILIITNFLTLGLLFGSIYAFWLNDKVGIDAYSELAETSFFVGCMSSRNLSPMECRFGAANYVSDILKILNEGK